MPVENATALNTANYFTPQTWTANNIYVVNGTQNFNAGLTIEPGTVVKLAPGVNLNINSGALTANGTADQPILFTALNPPSATSSKNPIGPQNVPVNLSQYYGVRYVSASHRFGCHGRRLGPKSLGFDPICAGSNHECQCFSSLCLAGGRGNLCRFDCSDGRIRGYVWRVRTNRLDKGYSGAYEHLGW